MYDGYETIKRACDFYIDILAVAQRGEADELKNLIMYHAIQNSQGGAQLYFHAYFQQPNACRHHPLLGDLLTLAQEIEAASDPRYGINLAAFTIRHHLGVSSGVENSDTEMENDDYESSNESYLRYTR